jgi:uncharacterized membrane protein
MSDSAAAVAGRRNGRILLVVSLAANLLLIGFVVGQLLHHPPHERGGPMTIERITSGLPPEVREAVRADLREHRPQIAEKIAAVRAAQADVRAAIGAEPFDPARLQAAFAVIRDRRKAVQEEVQAAAVEAIGKLPPETRRKLSN